MFSTKILSQISHRPIRRLYGNFNNLKECINDFRTFQKQVDNDRFSELLEIQHELKHQLSIFKNNNAKLLIQQKQIVFQQEQIKECIETLDLNEIEIMKSNQDLENLTILKWKINNIERGINNENDIRNKCLESAKNLSCWLSNEIQNEDSKIRKHFDVSIGKDDYVYIGKDMIPQNIWNDIIYMRNHKKHVDPDLLEEEINREFRLIRIYRLSADVNVDFIGLEYNVNNRFESKNIMW